MVNDTDKPITLHKHTTIGIGMECEVELESKIQQNKSLPRHFYSNKAVDKYIRSIRTELKDPLPEHLQDLFERSCGQLMDKQQLQLKSLLFSYQDIFSKSDTDIGCFTEIKHTINTGDATPIKQPMRRTQLGFSRNYKLNQN
jgi:hypothetical protein